MSTAWQETNGYFIFEQIRPSQDWDRIVFIGINPESIELYWATKEDVEMHIESQDGIVSQHLGPDGRDTFWVKGCPHWFRAAATW
jgi:hypothetical protein